MAVDWGLVVTNIGSTTAIVAILAYAARSLFSQHLTKDLEAFKAELQISSDRAQRQFTILQEKRAQVLDHAYVSLVRVHRAANSLLAEMEFAGEPSKIEKSVSLAALGNELAEYFDEHSIYFSKSTCSKFESLFKSIRDPSMRFSTVLHMAQQYPEDRDLAKMKHEAWIEGAQRFREEVPPLKEALADDFREILGVEEQVGSPTT